MQALKSSPVVTRYPGNPILSAKDIPYPSELVFNAGVAKYEGKYVMVFRNDYDYVSGCAFGGCNLGVAYSDDGVKWSVRSTPLISAESWGDPEIRRIYDPRLTVIDGRVYLCLAVDTAHGIRGAIARTDDFEKVEFISLTVPDNRNMVLFPEKIGGRFVRLERPFPIYGRGGGDRFDTWLSKSPDLIHWGDSSLLLAVENVPYANDKTGPGAPPIKTEKGWLTLFHAVDLDPARGKNGWEETWKKRYCAGVMLLDKDCPEKIIGISRTPLIVPEARYEAQDGFRTNVVFPGGMILEDNGEVKIYYGAADTVECLATACVDDLIALCEPPV